MIYVTGDSHIGTFAGNKKFIIWPIGPSTAYNLNKKNSITNSNKKLFELANLIDKERDSIILVFGEIDCRIHIYYQFKKNNEKYTIIELIDNTIKNYGEVMKNLVDIGIKFYIHSIPPAGFQKNIYDYNWYATPEIHSKIYKEFNERLKSFCKEKGYRYIDIYSKTVDKDGFIKREYLVGTVHLNNNTLYLIVDTIMD